MKRIQWAPQKHSKHAKNVYFSVLCIFIQFYLCALHILELALLENYFLLIFLLFSLVSHGHPCISMSPRGEMQKMEAAFDSLSILSLSLSSLRYSVMIMHINGLAMPNIEITRKKKEKKTIKMDYFQSYCIYCATFLPMIAHPGVRTKKLQKLFFSHIHSRNSIC